jgi:FkbM family methyltransferase
MKNRTCNHEESYALSTLSWAAQTSFLPARAKALFVKLAERGWRIFSRKPVIRDVHGIGLMKLMPWDLLGARLFFYGVWEPAISEFVRSHLGAKAVAIDIGANIGYYTLLFSHLVGEEGMVYSVEPSPSIRRNLEENIRLNELRNVSVVPYGISNQSGAKDFYLRGRRNLGASHFGEALPGDRLEGTLELRQLTQVVPSDALSRTALVKVDVEGMEHEVLQYLLENLFHFPHRLVILSELRVPTHEASVCHLMDNFRNAGFESYVLDNRYGNDYYAARATRPPQRIEHLGPGQYDIAFVRH